jgi:hypothetical protein
MPSAHRQSDNHRRTPAGMARPSDTEPRIILQRLKAMCATGRNVQRDFAMRIEPERRSVQIAWRARPQIGGHIGG